MKRYSILTVLIVAVLAFAAAGCGDSDSTTTTTGTTQSEDTGISKTQAKKIFVETCGGCHALKDAGTSGSVGPNLDQLEPNTVRVETQIKQGGAQMPANLLRGEEARAVAKYVSEVAGK